MSSKKSPFKLLQDLMNAAPDRLGAQDIFQGLEKSNDASAILVAVSLLTHALKDVIIQNCRANLTQFDIEGLFNEDKGGPLHTFSSRIRIAYALGAIGKDTREDLNTIRKIRNALAHAQGEISFATDPLPYLSSQIGLRAGPGEADPKHAKIHFVRGSFIIFLRISVYLYKKELGQTPDPLP